MSTRGDEWILDGLGDNMDVSTVGTRIQVRDHWTLTRHRKVKANRNHGSQQGQTRGYLTYQVGAVVRQKSVPIGRAGAKWLCVADTWGPEQPGTPGEYCFQQQTWEFYSAWEDPPPGWNV